MPNCLAQPASRLTVRTLVALYLLGSAVPAPGQDQPANYSVLQVTHGPRHHLFGYIGHVRTIPWNAGGRYIVALRTDVQDHLPTADEPAEIVLLDTDDDYSAEVLTQTHAWNLQQGTMLYWNPSAPETQFFFNDRDPADGKVFTVLYDIERRQRIREYRFSQTPIANSGVAQNGGAFLGINYARLARLRPVTGYADAFDWTTDDPSPADDGIFRVDVETGEGKLLVSYDGLRRALAEDIPDLETYHLFINHTLWNRDDDRIYFYVRANFKSPLPKVDVPFTINADGSGLQRQQYVGGHPEWDAGHVLIGSSDGRQVRYDTDSGQIIGPLSDQAEFPNPGGDIALSPDGDWFVNGHKSSSRMQNLYTFLHRPTGRTISTVGFPIGTWLSGPLRIDPAPGWNRTGDRILFGALDPDDGTRQLYVLTLHR